jgi:hypothetical protein
MYGTNISSLEYIIQEVQFFEGGANNNFRKFYEWVGYKLSEETREATPEVRIMQDDVW